MPGIYRQTTEISGTLKQMVSSKKCNNNNQKITPSHSLPNNIKQYERDQHSRFITPLPTDYAIDDDDYDDEFNNYKQYYAAIHTQPLVRQYTPPEKRYSASFGHRLPERKNHVAGKSRYLVGEREFCSNEECYVNQGGGSVRNLQNVKVNNCPLPEFNQLYIQENFE